MPKYDITTTEEWLMRVEYRGIPIEEIAGIAEKMQEN